MRGIWGDFDLRDFLRHIWRRDWVYLRHRYFTNWRDPE